MDFYQGILWRGQDAVAQDGHMPAANDEQDAITGCRSNALEIGKDSQEEYPAQTGPAAAEG